MSNLFLHTFIALIQQVPPPPVPKSGTVTGPPGDVVPLDGGLWILLFFALALGAVMVYRSRKVAL